MDIDSAHLNDALAGNRESLLRLLSELVRPSRLIAAIFLPTMHDVDRTVQRWCASVSNHLPTIPRDQPIPWLRGELRDLIVQRLDELDRDPEFSGDPILRLLLSSGRERLTTVLVDSDPVQALNGRLRYLTKGATDLLEMRFSKGITFANMAAQRLLTLDDLSVAVQTACRQLDWTGETGGSPLDPADYRAIDGLICGTQTMVKDELEALRGRLLDDLGLALRTVRAARLHLIAAAWHAPALAIDLPATLRRQTDVPRLSSASRVSVTPRQTSPSPPRRQIPNHGSSGRQQLARGTYSHRQFSAIIPTLIGGALVLGGITLLILRSGVDKTINPVENRSPTTTPISGDNRSPTPATPVTAPATSVAAPPVAAPATPVAAKDSPLFVSHPTSRDLIVGESQNPSLVGYKVNAVKTNGVVGNQGSNASNTRMDSNVVLGYPLPILPAGSTLDDATLSIEITGAENNMGNIALEVYLLNTPNPDTSGISFFFHGPKQSDRTDAKWVGSTNSDAKRTSSDDEQRKTHLKISDEGLALLRAFYGGDHIPDQKDAFFRFSLSQKPELTRGFIRYFLDFADDKSSLTIKCTTSAK